MPAPPKMLCALICLSGILSLGRIGAQSAKQDAANPVAKIDGSVITKAQFDAYVERTWSGRIIRDMIVDRLIWREAARRKVKVTPEEVFKAVIRDKSNYASDAQFERALIEQGLSTEAYHDRKHRELVLQKLRELDAKVTDADVRRYYDTHRAQFEAGANARVSELVFDSLKAAYAARERMETPAQFRTVAAALVAKSEAELREPGWVAEETVQDAALREALQALQRDQVSAPVEDDTGRAHVLLLHERQPRPATSFRDAAAAIRARLSAERMLSEDEYVRYLIRRAKVSVEWESSACVQEWFDDAGRVRVMLDGRDMGPQVRPIRTESGSLLIPAKPVLTAIGAGLTWDAATQSLGASRGEHRVTVSVGKTEATVDGKPAQARLAPRMVEGNIYVEPRLVLEALGAAVAWDGRRFVLKIVSRHELLPAGAPAERDGSRAEPH